MREWDDFMDFTRIFKFCDFDAFKTIRCIISRHHNETFRFQFSPCVREHRAMHDNLAVTPASANSFIRQHTRERQRLEVHACSLNETVRCIIWFVILNLDAIGISRCKDRKFKTVVLVN
jgi:hypothetical protein